MMPSDFVGLDGKTHEFDLDAVHRLVRGYSKQRPEWTSSVVYEPKKKTLIEVRSSPQDIRGGSADEAQEVTEDYVKDAYRITDIVLAQFLRDPRSWKLIDQRSSAAAAKT